MPFEKNKKTTKNKNEQTKQNVKKNRTWRADQATKMEKSQAVPVASTTAAAAIQHHRVGTQPADPMRPGKCVYKNCWCVYVYTTFLFFFFFLSFDCRLCCLALSSIVLNSPSPPHGLLSLYSLRLRFRFCVPVSLQRIIAWGGRLLLRKRIPCVNLRFRLRVYFLAIQRRRRLRRQTHIDEDCFVVRSIRIFRNAC